jgi:hypothetical protein
MEVEHYKQFGLANTEFYCTNDQLEECNKVILPIKQLLIILKEEITLLISIRYYAFKGSFPTITSPYTKTIDINLIINKVPYAASGYFKEGVLGGKSDGSKTFITAARMYRILFCVTLLVLIVLLQ